MKSIITSVILLSFFSCATVSEYQATYKQELQQRDNRLFGPPQEPTYLSMMDDDSFNLLLGLYVLSLTAHPGSYPFYFHGPYLFSPLYFYSDLMIYQSMMDSINRMETFKMQLEVQRIIDEVRREAAKIKD